MSSSRGLLAFCVVICRFWCCGFGLWSFQASICISLAHLLSLEGRPSLFGPCPSGPKPVGVFFSGHPSCLVPCPLGFFSLNCCDAVSWIRRTVTLRVRHVPKAISQPELIRMHAESFGTWNLLAVQFLPGLRVRLTFDSEEAKTSIERHSELEI